MDGGEELDPLDEPATWALRPSETVLYRWTAPGGRGILTNQRLVLLSHPRPLHRSVRWNVDLEQVNALEVQRVKGIPGFRLATRGSFGGGGVSTGGIDATFGVKVNQATVYIGDPNPCGDLQRRIDDARTARCLALYGGLRPYTPAGAPYESEAEGRADLEVVKELGEPAVAAPPVDLGDPFVLFIAGEPFKDAVPGAGRPGVLGVFTPLGGPVESYGGHEPADLQPGQVYGREAEIGRMVVDIGRKCGTAVKVVDVDNPGDDLGLVQQFVRPEDPLPLLLRSDGARLNGEESMGPAAVARFLQRR